jgi:hypothetical protein
MTRKKKHCSVLPTFFFFAWCEDFFARESRESSRMQDNKTFASISVIRGQNNRGKERHHSSAPIVLPSPTGRSLTGRWAAYAALIHLPVSNRPVVRSRLRLGRAGSYRVFRGCGYAAPRQTICVCLPVLGVLWF